MKTMPKSRKHGEGGLTYIPARNLWRATLAIPGQSRRWEAHSRSRDVAEKRLLAKRAEVGLDTLPPVLSRAENMRLARERASHSPAEYRALYATAPDACPYCAVPLNPLNETVDHKAAVAADGSDAIGNMQIICWQCNLEKAKSDAAVFAYRGPVPRPFRPHPHRMDMARARGWADA